MQKITIAEVKPAEAQNKPTVITDSSGARMSGFDTKLKDLNPGDIIEAELEVQGKYTNIKKFNLVKKATATETAAVVNTKDASIEAQVAAKIGGELLAAGVLKTGDPLGQLTIAWCVKKLEPVVKDSPKKAPDIQWEDLKSESMSGFDIESFKKMMKDTNTEEEKLLAWIKDDMKIDKPSLNDAVLKMTRAQREYLVKAMQVKKDSIKK